METEKKALQVYALLIITSVLTIVIGFMGIKLKETSDRLASLERGTSERMLEQQKSIDSMKLDIEDLWDNADAVNESLTRVDDELQNVRQIQSNTNSALTRLRKQKDELEKKLEEGLELRRQRLAEMMAARNTSSGGWAGIGNGVFELTAYAWSGQPCANGEYPIPGYTVASNWFPIGTRLYIEGIGERVVTDTGGMSNNVIDIYMGDPETCWQFGRQTAEVYVIED